LPPKGICPKCGLPYPYIKRSRRGSKVHLYAIHYHGYERLPNGKTRKKVRECYLGPEDQYEYVTRTHVKEGLVLKGMVNTERALTYLDALIKHISSTKLRI